MAEEVVWEESFEVNADKDAVEKEIKEYRESAYGVGPQRLGWSSSAKKAGYPMAILTDTFARGGHVEIHFEKKMVQLRITVQAICHDVAARPASWPSAQEAAKRIADAIRARWLKPDKSRARGDSQIKATIAHYLITVKKLSKKIAYDRADIDGKTYRKYKEKQWLLSAAEFLKIKGTSLEDAAEMAYRA